MAERITVARPYAEAVFDMAQADNALAKWSDILQLGAGIVTDPAMHGLIGNPRVTAAQLTDLILSVAGGVLDEQGRNLIRLLLENRRLTLLPEIAALYEQYRREAEGTVEAEIITAFPLDEAQQKRIAAALNKRLGRTVTLRQTVDDTLMGGVIIRTEDRVIDGSVTAQLDRLTRALAG